MNRCDVRAGDAPLEFHETENIDRRLLSLDGRILVGKLAMIGEVVQYKL